MSSDELRSWVVALHAPRAVHEFRLKAWAGFLRERMRRRRPGQGSQAPRDARAPRGPPVRGGGRPEVRGVPRVHARVVRRGAGGGTPPTILPGVDVRQHQTKARAADGAVRARIPRRDQDAARGRPTRPPRVSTPNARIDPRRARARSRRRRRDARREDDDTAGDEILRAADDARDETKRLAAAGGGGESGPGFAAWRWARPAGASPPSATRRRRPRRRTRPGGSATRDSFAGFRRQGYPGFVGATNVVEDEIERRLGARSGRSRGRARRGRGRRGGGGGEGEGGNGGGRRPTDAPAGPPRRRARRGDGAPVPPRRAQRGGDVPAPLGRRVRAARAAAAAKAAAGRGDRARKRRRRRRRRGIRTRRIRAGPAAVARPLRRRRPTRVRPGDDVEPQEQ